MWRRRFLQLCCIIALLVAQQGALTHAVWHAHERAPVQLRNGHHDHADGSHAGSEHDAPRSSSWLCAFDLAFGTVLGGVPGSAALPDACAAGVECAVRSEPARFYSRLLPYLSRGPPTPL